MFGPISIQICDSQKSHPFGWLRIMVVCIVSVFSAAIGAGVEIIGYRGASHTVPENTLAAINLAWLQ